jgi:hypothetical protein
MSWHSLGKGEGQRKAGKHSREEMTQKVNQTYCLMQAKLENSTHIILQIYQNLNGRTFLKPISVFLYDHRSMYNFCN